MNDATPEDHAHGEEVPSIPAKRFPRPLGIFLAAFALAFLVVFGTLAVNFVSNLVNENSHPDAIEIQVVDHQIVSRQKVSPDYVIIAWVVHDDGTRDKEVFGIYGDARTARDIYAALDPGMFYDVTVNGDPEKYRVITGIVNAR